MCYMNESKFTLGQTVGCTFFKIKIMSKPKTPEQIKRKELSHKLTKITLERNLNPKDIECNNQALEYGSRILSSYSIPFSFGFDHNKLWIITEANRSSTTIFFPSDY